jgi:hypothetical protein
MSMAKTIKGVLDLNGMPTVRSCETGRVQALVDASFVIWLYPIQFSTNCRIISPVHKTHGLLRITE